MDLVNRLQARLDEEEFGMVDAPVVPVAPMVEPESTSLVPPPLPPPPTPVAIAAVVPPHDHDPEPVSTATGRTEQVHAEQHTVELKETPVVEKTGVSSTVKTPAISQVAVPNTTAKGASATTTTTTTTTGQTMVLPKITPDMSFEEKRRIRAARFNMTLVDGNNKQNTTGMAGESDKNKNTTTNKRGLKNDVVAEEGKSGTKKPKVDTVMENEEEELLPKEEIERRLKRLQKFSGEANQVAMDKLKAMLRKYRFMQKE